MANRLRRSTEKRSSVISKLNLEKPIGLVQPKFIYIDGVPHKMKDGKLVPLTKKINNENVRNEDVTDF